MPRTFSRYIKEMYEFSILLSYMFLNIKAIKLYASQVLINETSALPERSHLKKEKDFWNVNIVPLVILLFLSISSRYRTFILAFTSPWKAIR